MFQFTAKEGSTKSYVAPPPVSEGISFEFGSFTRHKYLIMGITLFCFLLGIAFCLIRPVSYSGKSELFVYNRGLQLIGAEPVVTLLPVEAALVQNQIEILQADKILLEVADILHLDVDAANANKSDFKKWMLGIIGTLTRFLPADAEKAANDSVGISSRQLPDDPKRSAVEALRKDLTVKRLGTSHVIEVTVNAPDPERASTLTNEIVKAYLRDQEAANAQAAQANSGWLRDRMKGLGPNTRVITEAVPSSRRNGPAILTILAASLLGGLFLGAVAAVGRDNFDKRILTSAQATFLTGSECFGSIPKLPVRRRKTAQKESVEDGTGLIASSDRQLSWTIDHPLSDAAHTLRRVRAASLEGHRKSLPSRSRTVQTMGVISSLPREGKTVVTANLGRLFSSAGYRVLVIDGVVYNAELSKLLAPNAELGLYSVLKKARSLAESVYLDIETDLRFLPLGTGDPNAVDLIWSQAMEELLDSAAASYDWVIFDLPPLLPFPDVRAAARLLDHFVLVAEWAKTPTAAIDRALAESGLPKEKLLGVILNKVKKMDNLGQESVATSAVLHTGTLSTVLPD
jgi:polysaccharide biosynthesis transport protein